MKRRCSLCLGNLPYALVKKYPHGLQVCIKCDDIVSCPCNEVHDQY